MTYAVGSPAQGGRDAARSWLMAAAQAITLAALTNAGSVFLTSWREATHSTGVEESGAFVITSVGLDASFDPGHTVRRDLDLIRATPGVLAATPAMIVPLSGLEASTGLSARPQASTDVRAFIYHVDEQGIPALGVHLIAGRAFARDDIVVSGPVTHDRWDVVIVSQALARALFGAASAIGRDVYLGGKYRARIVGVVERLDGPLAHLPPVVRQRSIMVPQIAWLNAESRYVVRTEERELRGVAALTRLRLAQADPRRQIQSVELFATLRRDAYFWEFVISGFAGAALCALIVVNSLGVFARALLHLNGHFPASRSPQRLRSRVARFAHLSAYAALPLLVGIGIGVLLSLTLNEWLVVRFNFPALTATTVVCGGIVVAISNQGALLVASLAGGGRRTGSWVAKCE